MIFNDRRRIEKKNGKKTNFSWYFGYGHINFGTDHQRYMLDIEYRWEGVSADIDDGYNPNKHRCPEIVRHHIKVVLYRWSHVRGWTKYDTWNTRATLPNKDFNLGSICAAVSPPVRSITHMDFLPEVHETIYNWGNPWEDK